MARIVDDTGLIAIDVDRSVWLDARGEDVPGQLVGPVQRAWVHGPVRTVGREHRPNSRAVHVHSAATRGSHTSPSLRLRRFCFPVRPTRANVDGRRLPAATTKEGPSP